MDKQEIVYKDLDDLHISTENPRTGTSIDETGAIHKLIFEQKDKMVGLLKSIIEGDWIVGELPGLLYEKDNYVVYEGNRRVAVLKCFFDITLLPEKEETADKIKKYVSSYSKEEIKTIREKFTKIPCALFNKKEDVLKYMEKRHTTNQGRGDALEKWNFLSNELFKSKVSGKKSIIVAIYNDYINLFTEVDNLAISTLERILKNPTSKEKIGYDFSNEILSVSDEKTFRKYLNRIICDIKNKDIDSRKLSTSKDIAEYIYKIMGLQIPIAGNSDRENINTKEEKQSVDNQMSISSDLSSNTSKSTTNSSMSSTSNNDSAAIPGNKRTKTKIQQGLWFAFLETKGVDRTNMDNIGILYIADELKRISKAGDYKKYPSATAMLIRNLLEQSLKYQLFRKNEWDNMLASYRKKSQNNIDREPGLEYIVNYCMGNINNVFPNAQKIQISFRIFGQNLGTKDYFNGIVHSPEMAPADYTVLEKIARAGLYKIIFHILNS
jgi:hypothetical protein